VPGLNQLIPIEFRPVCGTGVFQANVHMADAFLAISGRHVNFFPRHVIRFFLEETKRKQIIFEHCFYPFFFDV
jgi:hypothetical protein